MKIVYSDHAEDRIAERKIRRPDIVKTITNPDEVDESFRDRNLFRKKINSKILEVIVKREKSKIIIITAYYLN